MDRRRFLARLIEWVGLVPAALGVAGIALRFLVPPARADRRRKVFVADRSELPEGSSRELTDLRGEPLILLRRPDSAPVALSLVCTHLGCHVRPQPDGTFLCPCHQGLFDSDGKVLAGPPPAALTRYDVAVEGDEIFIAYEEA